MKLSRLIPAFLLDIQFWVAVLLGWFICGSIWSYSREDVNESRDALEAQCQPCVDPSCPECDPEDGARDADALGEGFYRDFAWKPTSFDEDADYWTVTANKHRAGMVNEDPRVGLNGIWRLEKDEIDEYLRHNTDHDVIRGHDTITDMKLNRMMRKMEPFFGVSYIVDMDVTRKGKDGKREMFEVRRKFKSGKPNLIDIKRLSGVETVHIITPLSKVTERFHKFMERLEQNIYQRKPDTAVRLVFVIFGSESSPDSRASLTALEKFQLRNPTADLLYVFVEGEFSRAVGLDTGVKQCPEDGLMLFLDVDLSITLEFLDRVRGNTIQNRRVVFPVMFSQFDPDLVQTYMKTAWVPEAADGDVSGDKGFWIYYAFGVASMYKSDYLKVGGFRLDITGWGGEDVDLFKKLVSDSDLDVMTTVDPDLIHIYHSRACDTKLSPDQYRMCIGALAETIGSQVQLGTLYLKNREDA